MESDVSQLLLIVDDPQSLSELVAHYEQLEYQVQVAKSPLHALQLLTELPIHLILFDYQSSNATQTALLQDVLDKSEEIPLVLIANVESADDVTALLRLGATAVFSRPLDSQAELDKCIARHVRHAKLFFDNLRYRQQLEQANTQLNESLAELERDQQAGRLMQQRLMPPEQSVENGLLIRRHMQSSLYLSGDFVDHISLPDGQLLFYLADVSGHGASSAILTVLLKTLSRQILGEERASNDGHVSLANIVGRLNDEILHFDVDKHLTMFMGMISADKRTLTYCVGGHYPMPVLQQRGATDYLPGLGSGFPLGLFEGAEYEEMQQSLDADFALMLCSDGVLEIIPNDEQVDQQAEFISILQQHGCHITGLIDGLELDKYDQVPDDIAVLSIVGENHG
jgi:serine phosphatase RsbU (regulator of sigma subunit)